MDKIPFTVNYSTMTLIPPTGLRVLGVKGENRSTRHYFLIDLEKAQCDWDLSTATWEVKYQNALGETGRQVLTDVKEEDGMLTMSFFISASLSKMEGKVFIELCAHGNDGSNHWHVSPYRGTIGNFIKPTCISCDDPKYDIVTQILEMFKKYPDPEDIDGKPISMIVERQEHSSLVTFIQEENVIGQFEVMDGKDGEKGEKGESFTFDDLTPEQKEELKGEKGDPAYTEELTPNDLDKILYGD